MYDDSENNDSSEHSSDSEEEDKPSNSVGNENIGHTEDNASDKTTQNKLFRTTRSGVKFDPSNEEDLKQNKKYIREINKLNAFFNPEATKAAN